MRLLTTAAIAAVLSVVAAAGGKTAEMPPQPVTVQLTFTEVSTLYSALIDLAKGYQDVQSDGPRQTAVQRYYDLSKVHTAFAYDLRSLGDVLQVIDAARADEVKQLAGDAGLIKEGSPAAKKFAEWANAEAKRPHPVALYYVKSDDLMADPKLANRFDLVAALDKLIVPAERMSAPLPAPDAKKQ